jgi:isoamylase
MISGGDEFGRTQGGNNNAYCQDSEISWYEWRLDDERKAMLAFTKKLIALRRDHPALRRAKFFKGRKIFGTNTRDLMWFNFDGRPMNEGDWTNAWAKSLSMFLAGRGVELTGADGEPVGDDDLIVLINGSHEPLDFTMPDLGFRDGAWELIIDTSSDAASETVGFGGTSRVDGRSLKLFRRPDAELKDAIHS